MGLSVTKQNVNVIYTNIIKMMWDFPGGPMVKTSPSNAGGNGSIHSQGTKIPHGSWPKNQKRKTEAIL